MARVPEWERLADALKRAVASGVAESQAKVAICNAIADRSVTVHLVVGNLEGADIFLIEGWERDVPSSRTVRDYALWESASTGLPPREPSLMIPRHTLSSKRQQVPLIVPEDFDWQESRPLKPWRSELNTMGGIFRDWRTDRIELCSADVTRVLIAPPSDVPTRKKPAAAKQTINRSPKREQASIELDKIYSGRIPPRDEEPDAILIKKAAASLTTKFGKDYIVSADTILRAAGRRKDRKGGSRHG